MGLPWLQASCAISVGGCHASSLSPDVQHLRTCPRDRLLLLPETPSPTCLYQRGLLWAAGVLKSHTWSRRGKWWGHRHEPFVELSYLVWVSVVVEALFRCGPASPSHCLALHTRLLFLYPFLGAVRGGTGGCCSLTSWRGQGPGWFCLWALDLDGGPRVVLLPLSLEFRLLWLMLVCRVAPLVERCDTYLWLLSALCWLVANSGKVLPEFFSVGSGGGEPRREVRHGAAARPGCGGLWLCSWLWIASLTLPREVVGKSRRSACWRCGRCVLLLGTCGGGLVALAVT
ncbi:hypothetical protein Taro_045312, partial [Colocasia esculenta]|nr:hypothetical protein [Colocasia esculenta]